MVADLIDKLDVRIPVYLLSKDRYLVGTRIMSAMIENNTVSLRVGGGYLNFAKYIEKCQEYEMGKMKRKALATGESLDAVFASMK